MSLGARQVYAGVHLPPWQLVEQQSEPSAHASPSVLQALVPVGAGNAWQVVEQLPVQHSLPAEQEVPVALQEVLAHRPFTHDSKQHWLESAHAAPGVLQNAVVVQEPLLQAPEQHAAFEAQDAPESEQVETGVAHCWITGLQYPLWQTASEVQEAPFGFSVGGFAQTFVGSQ